MRTLAVAVVCLFLASACVPGNGSGGRPSAREPAAAAPASTRTDTVRGPWLLAFASEGAPGPDLDIYVAEVPSGKPRRVAGVARRDDFSPSLSPDGRWITYRRNPPRGDEGDIHVVPADGGTSVNLTRSPGVADWSPAWSPTGEQIAYASDADGDLEIWVMEADGSGQRQLTDDPAIDEYPTWSPDGSRMAINSTRDGQFDIWVIDVDGAAAINLTDHPASEEWPAWSPDGRWIAFRSDREGNDDVFVVRPDGSGLKNLTATPDLQESHPTWLPDGTLTFSRHGESGPVTVWSTSIPGAEAQMRTPAEPVFVYSWSRIGPA